MITFSKFADPAALFRAICLTTLLVLFAGCSTGLGPRTLGSDRITYQDQIVRTSDESMLLNIVRLRYGDNPLFLEVGSIVSTYQLGANLTLSGQVVPGPGTSLLTDLANGALGGNFVEAPTVTYTPLQGEAYATRLMSPVPVGYLMFFYETGWNIDRVLLVAVRAMNEVVNTPSASSPTAEVRPDYEKFLDLATRLRRLQIANLTGVNRREKLNAQGVPIGPRMWLRMPSDPQSPLAEDVRMVRQLLQLAPNGNELRLSEVPDGHDPDEIGIRTQSLMAILYSLSKTVEPPEEHKKAGLVTVTHDENGQPFDWSKVYSNLMRVQFAEERPSDAAVAVQYRDWWFYIAANDLASKSTFSLVNYLFALQSAPGDGRSPALTLPLGR